MLKINQIYKVKEGHEWKCRVYSSHNGKYIRITEKNHSGYYEILGEDKKFIGWVCGCFTEDDLELEEEVNTLQNEEKSDVSECIPTEKQHIKSLEDLEVGDEVIDVYDNLWTIKSIRYSGATKDNNFNHSIEELKQFNYRVYNPSELRVLSPSEAETLLEEKLGIKVKIKN